jgi:hypothetical protein
MFFTSNSICNPLTMRTQKYSDRAAMYSGIHSSMLTEHTNLYKMHSILTSFESGIQDPDRDFRLDQDPDRDFRLDPDSD